MERSNFFWFGFLCHFVLVLLVQAQYQSGFISLDCGLPENSSYTEPTSKINYISDAAYIQSGVSKSLSSKYKGIYERQLWYLRSFPQGIRNCYNVTTLRGTKYLIRASFLYGNYDGLHKLPYFDLYFGEGKWDTVKLLDEDLEMFKDIIHIPSTNKINICIINTGYGIPFISALEFRPLPNDTYKTLFGSLFLLHRWDIGSSTNQSYRFPDDAYDRKWLPSKDSEYTKLSTSLLVDGDADDVHNNLYHPAAIVMGTAIAPINASRLINLSWNWESEDEDTQYYVYMHFAEFLKLEANQTRRFNITYNGNLWHGPVIPEYLSTTTIYKKTPLPVPTNEHQIVLVQIENSTLPPIINAVEIYYALEILELETDQGERDAIRNIQSKYGLTKEWQGDPCVPRAYPWNGLSCSYDSITPRIISLDLSFSGLMGEISPFIIDLTMLQTLDLSNNSLTGKVPDFLSKLMHLQVLNLENNDLKGPIPPELIQRSNNGSLTLRLEGNPNLDKCTLNQCTAEKKKKKNNFIIPLVAAVGGLLFILVTAVIIFLICKKESGQQSRDANAVEDSLETDTQTSSSIEIKRPQVTYSEVIRLTKNFERLLGQGSSGNVYYGVVDNNIEVAVKILSQPAIQTYKHFQVEVAILLRAHHKNLTSLIGYFNEGTKLGLIYEYMVNGTLAQHLLETSSRVLTWEDRLCIAKDAARGLDYLHHGCYPPIIHRDIKSTKILLTADFQAKLSGLGLSKSFPSNGNGDTVTHVTTQVAGTFGYLDPEYYTSLRLTEKSDVYSFGIVLLEIITGKPVLSRTYDRIHITQWVNPIVDQGNIQGAIDPRLNGDYEYTTAWKAIDLARRCSSFSSDERPTMSDVVSDLDECLTMLLNWKPESRDLQINIADMMPTTVEFCNESNPRAR